MHSVFYKARRISRPYLVWRNVFGNNAACTYNSTLANSYRIANDNIDTNKYIFLNSHLGKPEHSPFLTRVKEMCKYSCSSCKCCSFFYCYKLRCSSVKTYITVYIARSLNIYPPPNFTNLYLR